MSRPKSTKPIKEVTVQSRMTKEELNFYKNFAQSNGMTISVLIRMALIQFCKDKK